MEPALLEFATARAFLMARRLGKFSSFDAAKRSLSEMAKGIPLVIHLDSV